jgi:hypothetical protein
MGEAMATPMNKANQTRTSLARNRCVSALYMLNIMSERKKATPFRVASGIKLEAVIGLMLRN